jgi:hypothetical protein
LFKVRFKNIYLDLIVGVTMISYIKLYGPPVLKALKILEKIAIDMPEVCIMNLSINASFSLSGQHPDININTETVSEYFSGVGEIPSERCNTIISKSGEKLGEYDFYFNF